MRMNFEGLDALKQTRINLWLRSGGYVVLCARQPPCERSRGGCLMKGLGGVLQLQDMANVNQNCIPAPALCFWRS